MSSEKLHLLSKDHSHRKSKNNLELPKQKPQLIRSRSLDSLLDSKSAEEFEGLLFFDPMTFSQCMPARSDKIWFLKQKRSLCTQIPYSPNESSGIVPEHKNDKSSNQFTEAENEENTSGECTDLPEKSVTSRQEEHRLASTTAESTVTDSVSRKDNKSENLIPEFEPMDIPSVWNYSEKQDSSLQKIIQIQKTKLQSVKVAVNSLRKKLGSCQEENFQLKSSILGLQHTVSEREYAIERLKTVIDDLSRDKDDMKSELSINKLRIELKVGCLVAEIKQLEHRERVTRGLLKEVCGDDEQALRDGTKLIHQNAKLKEVLMTKEHVIESLKKQLAETGVDDSKTRQSGVNEIVEDERKALRLALKEAEMERDMVHQDYQESLDQWEDIRCDMEKQNQALYDKFSKVEQEKESLASELSGVKNELDVKRGEVEKYDMLLTKRESELFESAKALNKYKLDTQRSLTELESEMQVVKKQNDDSYSLLEIATSDLKFLQKRNKELEKNCNDKELQREHSVRTLNELRLSDENLKMAKVQLEEKYTNVLTEVDKLTQRCDKMTRINAELEDSLVSMSEKNEALEADNRKLYDELEMGTEKLSILSEKTEESEKEKAELSEVVKVLREDKCALSAELEDLKGRLQLEQHEHQAKKALDGGESHVDILKSEIENLGEELRKRDLELLNYKQTTEARQLSKEKEMANECQMMSSELVKIINELDECKAESLKDTQSYQNTVNILKKEKAKLTEELTDSKQYEIGLKNMIKNLQDKFEEQEQRFKEESFAIFHETNEAKNRIAVIEEHFKQQLAAKDSDIANLEDVNNKMSEKLRELEEVICELQKREKLTCKDHRHVERQKKSLRLKLDNSRKLGTHMKKRFKNSQNRVRSLLNEVNEGNAKLTILESAGKRAAEIEKNQKMIIQDMTCALEEKRKENVSLKDKIKFQKTEAHLKEEKLKEMIEANDYLTKLSTEKTEQYDELLKNLDLEKEKQEGLENKADKYYNEMNDLNEQLRALRRECGDLKRRREDGDKLCTELQGKLKDVQKRCESLTNELNCKASFLEKTQSELSKLRVEYDNSQKQLEEKEYESRNLPLQLKSFVASQNNDLIMEVRRSHNNVMEAIHEGKMSEMKDELLEMKRKGALRREIAMSALGSKSCTTLRCS